MSYMVKFEFEAKSGKTEALSKFFTRILPGTRQFDGNKDVEASRSVDDENKFTIITHWEHAENLDKYLSWRQETGDFAELLTLLTNPPNIHTFEVLPRL